MYDFLFVCGKCGGECEMFVGEFFCGGGYVRLFGVSESLFWQVGEVCVSLCESCLLT